MDSHVLVQLTSINLINTAFLRFEEDAQYVNITSPFSRLYFIQKGEGELVLNGKRIPLQPGSLYLVPSFTPCSYLFREGLEHYFIHFSVFMENGLSPFDLYSIRTTVPCGELDYSLFKRLLKISPGRELPHMDPKIYQTRLWLNKKVTYSSVSQNIESGAIIQLLFSRFVGEVLNRQVQNRSYHNIQPAFAYIRSHMKSDISIECLAEMACLSKDYFSRLFKSIAGYSPCEYMIRQRLELAQLLLLTTDLSMEQIVEETNLKSQSYFSRIFKKYHGISPSQYRKKKD